MTKRLAESNYTPIANIAGPDRFNEWFDEKRLLNKQRAEEKVSSYTMHRRRLGPPATSFLSHNARFYVWRSKKAGWEVSVPSARVEDEGTQICVRWDFTPTQAIRAWKDYYRRMSGSRSASRGKGRKSAESG